MGWLVCRRTHQLRALIYRVCLNEVPKARSELRGTPHARAPQVARRRSRRDAVSRAAFFGGLFLAAKKSACAAGRTTRHLRKAQKSPNINRYQKQSPSPSRAGGKRYFYQ